ncbi:hypothetical protein PR048_011334 [Dryococelus australis]|uniref:Uncharacterized protein n=1 Tax=Dryococelus australis TaxID=614101 RepID=A0ABQ9HLA7_9NEOP|nr:hypothetical protein PR048_011334 [Dryococelus australis]
MNSPLVYHMISNDFPNNDNTTEDAEIYNEQIDDIVDVANLNTIENSVQVVNKDNTKQIAENAETDDVANDPNWTPTDDEPPLKKINYSLTYVSNGVETCEKVPCRPHNVEETKGETKCFIELAVQNKLSSSDSGIPVAMKREREPPKHKWSESVRDAAKKHMRSFLAYESHYTRKTTAKKYLPSHLNLTNIYEL